MKKLTLLICWLPFLAFSQDTSRKIEFPDVDGYLTLVTDLHIHTVFSDGSVWPDIRVQEALFDGVDAIALTEHLEYQPHRADIPHPDRNRSYELALEYAKNKELIVIRGAEITRSMPPGHSNAIFIKDANKLLIDDPLEVFREAKRQGAFVFWNHPHWPAQQKDGIATLSDLHKQLIAENLLDGIEVVNEGTYSDEALQIAQSDKLAIMGTSDIHGLIDWMFDVPTGGHRPVTLVLARERTEASIREALLAGRTIAWFKNNLIGNEANLAPLLRASIRVTSAIYQDNTDVLQVTVQNVSDARFILHNKSEYTLHESTDVVELAPQSSVVLWVKTKKRLNKADLPFEVLNALTAPGTHPKISLSATVNGN
ncbi:MAG: Sb-PDE family phosphodiesterase [Cyclobacteriaceae bacterium]|nr:Sb-PDE family phosphodiesterase [Cyclobacteriaceae bacterium]